MKKNSEWRRYILIPKAYISFSFAQVSCSSDNSPESRWLQHRNLICWHDQQRKWPYHVLHLESPAERCNSFALYTSFNEHCATKSSLRISKIRTNTRPLSPCSGRSTGSDKPKNSGFQRCPPELQQGEGRGHLQPQGSHLEQIFIKSGGNKKL